MMPMRAADVRPMRTSAAEDDDAVLEGGGRDAMIIIISLKPAAD